MDNYKNTLNLPSTMFPMKANLTTFELDRLRNWSKYDLYNLIRSKKNKGKLFFLHDGPPYANGNIHLGHAVNKILKDIVLKFKGFMGCDAPYIPGWDCHGLPIELQVERLFGRSIDVPEKEFYKICRRYALEQVDMQKKDFMRLGVLADWEHPYLTMDFKVEANIIRVLSKLISNGYVYKGVKPVHWCFQCRSVLAESEVEYNDRITAAVDVTFSVIDKERIIELFGISHLYISTTVELIIWTTAPWTLPANQAIAVHPDYKYQLIKIYHNNNSRYIVVAADLLGCVVQRIQCTVWEVLGEIIGSKLEFLQFWHPFMSFSGFVVLSKHVVLNSGTGLVHIAPSYGIDDYIIAQKYNLKVIDLVTDNGFYQFKIKSVLNGIPIHKANDLIINLLLQSNALLHVDNSYKHSYPYCWRHAIPVIFRATKQWFLDMNQCDLRNKLLKTICKVHWVSDKGKDNIRSMISNRPDWCLSRQRSWGVPIPLLVHKDTAVLHPDMDKIMELIAQRIEKDGIEVWRDISIADLIGKNEENQYKKVIDTLDVWFDSGSTYYTVISERLSYLKDRRLPDLYLEGVDQYRGWFMSSLIISTIIDGHAPYKAVLSHGFVVDSQGRKMSKSIGNIITPRSIIDKFGADILRLWVASSDYTKDMIVSNETLKYTVDIYRRIRNTVRFLLANLNDFHPEMHCINADNMIELDRWVVNQAFVLQMQVISDYNQYNFHNVVQNIMRFCAVDMGSIYLNIIKDRQYTTGKDSIARRSCQTALYHIIEAMVRWIAPILSYTADEIWRYIPGIRSKYVFTEEWYSGLFKLDKKLSMNNECWDTFFKVRNEVNKVLEHARIGGVIGSSLESCITLYATSELADQLRVMGDELLFGLIISSVVVIDYHEFNKKVEMKDSNIPGLKIVLSKSKGKKCLRCWHYSINIGQSDKYPDICIRCISNIDGPGENRKFF